VIFSVPRKQKNQSKVSKTHLMASVRRISRAADAVLFIEYTPDVSNVLKSANFNADARDLVVVFVCYSGTIRPLLWLEN
jgi:hypothetical protein